MLIFILLQDVILPVKQLPRFWPDVLIHIQSKCESLILYVCFKAVNNQDKLWASFPKSYIGPMVSPKLCCFL